MMQKYVVMAGLMGLSCLATVKVIEEGPFSKQGEQAAPAPILPTQIMTASVPASRNAHHDAVHLPKHQDGHFYADLRINERHVPVLVDTGASMLVLRESDARIAGLYAAPVDFKHPVNTANGQTNAALMIAEHIELETLIVSNADVMILPDQNLSVSLLGMNVLSSMGDVRFDQSHLTIERSR